MAMAQSIAMPRVGVNYGAHAPERLQQYAPVLCVDDLRQMVPWLFAEREHLGG
jgi:phosphoglycolate phosphatase